LFGELTRIYRSQRPAILAISMFFVVGAILLAFVNEQKGKAEALIPVDAEA
jgi:uncharacterized protein involved in exopolysaccharide biosynthesis